MYCYSDNNKPPIITMLRNGRTIGHPPGGVVRTVEHTLLNTTACLRSACRIGPDHAFHPTGGNAVTEKPERNVLSRDAGFSNIFMYVCPRISNIIFVLKIFHTIAIVCGPLKSGKFYVKPANTSRTEGCAVFVRLEVTGPQGLRKRLRPSLSPGRFRKSRRQGICS